MSDASVAAALRSDAQLVIVEAPAGCGKTHQAAEYAHWLATVCLEHGQALILTHTHAACDVFRARTHSVRQRIHITTIDGLITQIATIYHLALGLPPNVHKWVLGQSDGFQELALKVGRLLEGSRAVTAALVSHYPLVLCDEHQDANDAQHDVVMHLYKAGAKLRVFGDPMQAIYAKGKVERMAHTRRWRELCDQADTVEALDHPHRWVSGSLELGQWILDARRSLQQGYPIDLTREYPAGLSIQFGDNLPQGHGGIKLEAELAKSLRRYVQKAPSLMILSGQNDTVRGVNAFLYRSVPIWEGHTRDALTTLVVDTNANRGDPVMVGQAFIRFVQSVCKGFSDSAFAARFMAEVISGATKKCSGKPAQLQAMARCLLESPDHVGIAKSLSMLQALKRSNAGFADVEIDLQREFREAIRLEMFAMPDEGLMEMKRQRSTMPSTMPSKYISTVHKAKGLEAEHVLILPCDKTHFGRSEEKRCLMYVALSRAKSSLTLVVSPTNPSPWLRIPATLPRQPRHA